MCYHTLGVTILLVLPTSVNQRVSVHKVAHTQVRALEECRLLLHHKVALLLLSYLIFWKA